MTTEPTTRPEPWTVEELASIVERHAAHRYHCDGCVWIATLREASAALLDELEAAVRGLELASCGGYGCEGERAEDREQLLALIRQHREEGT